MRWGSANQEQSISMPDQHVQCLSRDAAICAHRRCSRAGGQALRARRMRVMGSSQECMPACMHAHMHHPAPENLGISVQMLMQ
jgi:hypothetical protein